MKNAVIPNKYLNYQCKLCTSQEIMKIEWKSMKLLKLKKYKGSMIQRGDFLSR